MNGTRYRQARTLVRKLTRLPNESKAEFSKKVLKLRKHFQQFNRDVAELCQWLMAINPDSKNKLEDARPFWKFFLEPTNGRTTEDVKNGDAIRLHLMEYVLGTRNIVEASGYPDEVLEAARVVVAQPRTPQAAALFERLKSLEGSHRLVLLKAAAEWVVARYYRQRESFIDRKRAFDKDKREWEARHSDLTSDIREAFNAIFKQLGQSDKNGEEGIRHRTPRVCTHDHMKGGLDNCLYAGTRVSGTQHGAWCVKFFEEFKPAAANAQKSEGKRPAQDMEKRRTKKFLQLATLYLKCRVSIDLNKKNQRKSAEQRRRFASEEMARQVSAQLAKDAKLRADKESTKGKKPKQLPTADQLKTQTRVVINEFDQNWQKYLELLEVREDTLLSRFAQKAELPHCLRRGDPCRHNPHTDACVKYKALAANLTESVRSQEAAYREWRSQFLLEPRKPVFKYPSAKHLPMPKIFGEGYWSTDFTASTLKLKMETGEWLEFGFQPWPRRYNVQPKHRPDAITSVQVNFIGNRARVGFRFDVAHKASRLAVSQEEIDNIRSREFPRASEDQQYLKTVRERIESAFDGDACRELRILAVDLGDKEAAWALLVGTDYKSQPCGAVPVVKIDRLREHWDDAEAGKGLRVEHVLRHQEKSAQMAQRIVEHRKPKQPDDGQVQSAVADLVGAHDLRGRFIHVRRMIRDWVRLNASQIIKLAELHQAELIVVDGSRRATVPAYNNPDLPQKQRKAYRAFGQIRHKLREKAVERGMRVVTVPEEGTSRICHACGEAQANTGLLTKNKAKRVFECEHCGIRTNSDLNAAVVLGRVFWGELHPPAREATVDT